MARARGAVLVNDAPAWIVRFDLLPDATLDDVGNDEIVLAGKVIDGGVHGRRCVSASLRLQQPIRPLVVHPDRIEVRCALRPVPPSGNADPATSLDHVVHILCIKLGEPMAIEEFLQNTAGMIDPYWEGREAWLEPMRLSADAPYGEGDDPIFDDVFVARYPDADAWRAINAEPQWKLESDRMETEMAAMMHVLIEPEINNVARHR